MTTTATGSIEPVTTDTFDELVLQAPGPVLVEFWAPWCGPCRMLTPVLQQLARDNADRITVLALNSDENRSTTAALGILGLPTVQLYDGGRLVREIRGSRPKAYLTAQLAGYLGD